MRAVTRNSVFYVPEPTPADAQELPAYIARELEKIRIAVDMLALGHLDKTHVAPAKPREGDIRLADGTDWNPGSGAGFYGYYGGAWAKLG
jgi:hypothetical protein